MGPYVADFYCAEAGVVVEADGKNHAYQAAHDRDRNAWMESKVLKVLRIKNAHIHESLEIVLWTIAQACGRER